MFRSDWDVDYYREVSETAEQWKFRRAFMTKWKHDFTEERVVCLSKLYINIEFLGCRYPAKVEELVKRLSKDIPESHRHADKNKRLTGFFALASTAAEGRKRMIHTESNRLLKEVPFVSETINNSSSVINLSETFEISDDEIECASRASKSFEDTLIDLMSDDENLPATTSKLPELTGARRGLKKFLVPDMAYKNAHALCPKQSPQFERHTLKKRHLERESSKMLLVNPKLNSKEAMIIPFETTNRNGINVLKYNQTIDITDDEMECLSESNKTSEHASIEFMSEDVNLAATTLKALETTPDKSALKEHRLMSTTRKNYHLDGESSKSLMVNCKINSNKADIPFESTSESNLIKFSHTIQITDNEMECICESDKSLENALIKSMSVDDNFSATTPNTLTKKGHRKEESSEVHVVNCKINLNKDVIVPFETTKISSTVITFRQTTEIANDEMKYISNKSSEGALIESMSEEDNLSANAPNASEVTSDESGLKKHKLTGAAKRRLKRFLAQGMEFEKAYVLCLKPLLQSERHTVDIKSSMMRSYINLKVRPKNNINENVQGIKVAIMDKKPMTFDLQNKLQKAILEAIDRTPEENSGPRFKGCSMKPDWLELRCEDQESYVWLAEVVKGLKPWPDAKLTLRQGEEIPKVKVGVVRIPGAIKEPVETILLRLQKQNIGLNSSDWKVLNKKVEDTGQTLTLAIDDASYKVLENIKFKPYLSYGTVVIHMKNHHQKVTEKHVDA